MYGGRARLEEALLADKPQPDPRVVAVHSLLWLADMVGAGRLQHHEIVRLFTSGASLDFVVDLMERFATGRPEGSRSPGSVDVLSSPAQAGPGSGMATNGRDETTIPEQVVESIFRTKAGTR